MTPDKAEPTSPEAENETPASTAENQEDAPAAPLNRAERRAQAQGKKRPGETGGLAGLRANKIQGSKGNQSGGGSKTRFMRKV